MAKKQLSFADKAAGSKDKNAVYVKYVKSVKSEKTGQWRFNEQMIRSNKGENLDIALKRMDEVANLIDIDLSQFESQDEPSVETVSDEVQTEVTSTEQDEKSADETSEKPLKEESSIEE
ncbi:MAG: DUF4295 family protein [Fidelibacterota bacterium]